MAISEMRRLKAAWDGGTGWPKRLEWLEIKGIRGWGGQKVVFNFPIVAIVGENGVGKSTVIQAAASVYKAKVKKDDRFASDFFPDTPFEKITEASIRFAYREGDSSQTRMILKPTDRWRRNPDRPERRVEYVDLSRIQPVGARVGYAKLLKANVVEGTHAPFASGLVQRFSEIVGKVYSKAGFSKTSVDTEKAIPVVESATARYSGFHSGAGEIAAAELLAADYPKYGLVLIDEIETSLHPRAQRRLIRDLAKVAREKELQIVITTHSPYVLEELPPEARTYIMDGDAGKVIMTGVSPEFAMTRMDEENYPECDVFVEDPRAQGMLTELITTTDRELLTRLNITPYGTAGVGKSLGVMNEQGRWKRPTVVFLDGDQDPSPGCAILPGGDAPERVLFSALKDINWKDVPIRVNRGPSETIDALNRAMVQGDHKKWVSSAADELVLGTDTLWQALCASYAQHCASVDDRTAVVQPLRDALTAH